MAEIRSKGAIGHVGRRGRTTGSSLGKIFKNTRGSRRPRASPPPSPLLSPLARVFQLFFFFTDCFLCASSLFFRALGFFSYPLAGHLPLRKGRPRCAGPAGRGWRPRKTKKDAYSETAQTRDDLSKRETEDAPGWEEDGEQRENRGSPSSGGNGLRLVESLRSQLVAL